MSLSDLDKKLLSSPARILSKSDSIILPSPEPLITSPKIKTTLNQIDETEDKDINPELMSIASENSNKSNKTHSSQGNLLLGTKQNSVDLN
jgi:hypothetical protein